MKEFKSEEEYKKELEKRNPKLKIVGKYSGAKVKTTHLCTKHNITWDITPDNALKGTGCKICGHEAIGERNSMSYDTYIQRLQKVNPNIICIGEYKNATTKVKHKCLIDGYEWEAKPSNILFGFGCPKCGGHMKRTHDDFIDEVERVNTDVEILGRYENSHTKIKTRCKKCGYTWDAFPATLLRGAGCIKCGFKKTADALRKSQEKYEEQVKNINSDIEVIGEYVTTTTPILHRCLACGNEWMAYPNNILKGHGCPRCKESLGEKYISEYLDNKDIVYERQKRFDGCKDKRRLPFDFYLPEYNACIEYDGLQHYNTIDFFGGEEGFDYRSKHDRIKNEFCENNDIRLLRIMYGQDIDLALNDFLFI